MTSVNRNLVFRQYLSNLPTNILACPLMNYAAKKLADFSVVKIFIMASLCKWEDLRKIESGIRSGKKIRKKLGLSLPVIRKLADV